jgi:hypothetical protein
MACRGGGHHCCPGALTLSEHFRSLCGYFCVLFCVVPPVRRQLT